ncbi:hypothetical protein DBR44_18965 [Aquitalea sp. FJL05]|uniref:hypothetical protein n=1 Tax=Aquitalea sp. FJL05 TaxID=2153366 RepID=UPI000F59DAC3|nr:hypothetical protein [Aquitalea sp. FJL05]RQO65781.1 hypothetical protein DBR44_18965 [Aquitalea sp. FJL05]
MNVADILTLMADTKVPSQRAGRPYALAVAFAQALSEISPKLTPLEMNMMIRFGRELCLQDAEGVVSALEAEAQIARIMRSSRSAGE